MDGVLARANCLLITTLWPCFKFIMLPIGTSSRRSIRERVRGGVRADLGLLHRHRRPAEMGGSLFGKQRLRVWGIGDVNRKSIGGHGLGLRRRARFCLWIVIGHGLPAPWIGLAVAIAVSNTLLELFSPRGTDDFTMATANALLCLGFGIRGPLVRGPLVRLDGVAKRRGLKPRQPAGCASFGPATSTGTAGPRTTDRGLAAQRRM